MAQRGWSFVLGVGLVLWLCCAPVAAQTESATAEDGAPAAEEPTAPGPSISTVPPLQVGANLTPPLGVLPPPVTNGLSAGQPGDATVSTGAGTVTGGPAAAAARAPRAPETEPVVEESGVATCADFPTWYDAQMMLESAVDTAVLASLDADGDAIACEELMYP
jgi:hypothetical protein